MASGVVNYPVEIIDAAQKITKSAAALNGLMADMTRDKNALLAVSGGAAATAFNEVQDAWNKSGLANNTRLQGVARAANDSQARMTDFDRHMAQMMRGNGA